MAYKERLVRSYEEVVESAKSFERGLNEGQGLLGPRRNYTVWYYIPEIDTVGPSKFIGYRGMTAEFYMAHTGRLAQASLPSSKRLDGRETEPVLRKWFEVTEPGTPEHKFVKGIVEELLARWGKRPHKNARYCVPIGFKLTE